MLDETDALGFTPNSAHELLAVEIVALSTKLDGASPSAMVCLVRSAVSWSVGLRVVEEAVEIVVEVLVVVVAAIEEGVVDMGRLVVGVP